jgi:hypothetical protein
MRGLHELALLYTNEQNEVVFADNSFLKMVDCGNAGVLVGEPLHRVLGVQYSDVAAVMRKAIERGYVHEQPLEIMKGSGLTIPVLFTCVATYDERGTFIGADIALSDPSYGSLLGSLPTDHAGLLQARAHRIYSSITEVKVRRESQILLLYFAAQVSALQVLVARLAGPRVLKTFEGTVNKSAQRHETPIWIDESGEVAAESSDIRALALRAVLADGASFVSNIVGRRAVQREIEMVDEQMDPEVISLAAEVKLYPIF